MINIHNTEFNRLKIKQIDKKLKNYHNINIPTEGWIKYIRKLLKISGRNLSKKLGVKPQVLNSYEKNEVKGTVSLNTLKKTASAMNCKLVYLFVPQGSFNNIIEKQAQLAAENLINRVSHSMTLEKQKLDEEEIKMQISRIKEKLINEMPTKMWDYEDNLS